MGVIGNHKNRKYGNKKYEFNGVKFDSKLELFFYNKLNEFGIKFEFQVPITLQEKFRFRGVAIREIGMRLDFKVFERGMIYLVDTKGFPTADAIIKYKILKYINKDKPDVDIIWLKNQKEVVNFLIKIKNDVNIK